MKERRKRRFRGLMALLLALAVLTGVAQSSTTVTVEAASKLTKTDFKKSTGKYRFNFIKLSKNYQVYYQCINMVGETEKSDKVFQTSRKIHVESTKADVIKKYGKTQAKKVNVGKDNVYYALKKTNDDPNAVSRKEIKKAKTYLDYKITISGSEYRLRFYLDKNKKVNTIAYVQNYDDFRNVDWSKASKAS